MSRKALLAAYLRQQSEIAMPDIPVSFSFDLKGFIRSIASLPVPVRAEINVTAKRGGSTALGAPKASTTVSSGVGVANPYTRLSRLKPLAPIVGTSRPSFFSGDDNIAISSLPPLTYNEKRTVFKELYIGRCSNCPLSGTRKTFVFGAGNVDARLMIIGEAPGADEDRLGVPFVGAAGKLLTELLQAVSLDRKKDVFITNVLKCRPPGNRTPGDAEIVACMPLLHRQIEVVAPAVLLLLGRTAAHALLGVTEAIGILRGKQLDYRGIVTVVTYHPAALLRTPGYRAGTEVDLQRVVRLLKEDRDYAAV
jgi:DNA polymerase